MVYSLLFHMRAFANKEQLDLRRSLEILKAKTVNLNYKIRYIHHYPIIFSFKFGNLILCLHRYDFLQSTQHYFQLGSRHF